MLNGTACKLKEKLKTATEPAAKNEAKEIRNNSEISFEETVNVRGMDVKVRFFTNEYLIGKRSLGSIPLPIINGSWMAKCKNAPKITPQPKPERPIAG